VSACTTAMIAFCNGPGCLCDLSSSPWYTVPGAVGVRVRVSTVCVLVHPSRRWRRRRRRRALPPARPTPDRLGDSASATHSSARTSPPASTGVSQSWTLVHFPNPTQPYWNDGKCPKPCYGTFRVLYSTTRVLFIFLVLLVTFVSRVLSRFWGGLVLSESLDCFARIFKVVSK